jgi:tetratricopeptide (TPR) repeat protein
MQSRKGWVSIGDETSPVGGDTNFRKFDIDLLCRIPYAVIPIRQKDRTPMPKMTAFIARSFSKEDEARLRPTLEFLESFRNFGFVCESAEPAEVESVSRKVRRIIDQSDVLIGFFTKRHPVYNPMESSWFKRSFKKPKPVAWSSPPWVLQESGYALAKNKKLILLREVDVEIPGLQGDLEYVPFVPERASDVFAKLSAMIHELMAEAAGIKVEVTVSEQGQIEPPTPAATNESAIILEQPSEPLEPHKPSIVPLFIDMMDAAAEANFEKIEAAFEQGKSLVDAGKVDFDPLQWDCIHWQYRFKAGSPNALDSLRKLHEQYPERAEPLSYIASILQEAKEHEDAANLYLKAAGLAKKPAGRISFLIRSARAFDEAKLVDRANQLAWQAYQESADDEQRREASALLYEILRSRKEMILAFAIAEAALHDNPKHSIRFRLGLDYHGETLNDLFLLHFQYLCDSNQNASALHNLALALSECGLPILSVEAYKSAIELGETLSAANLAFKYLDAGMATNAKEILKPAMQVVDHEPAVDKCYAEIDDRKAAEGPKRDKLIEDAHGARKFLVALGHGLKKGIPQIGGTWRLPFGDIDLKTLGVTLAGMAEITKEETGLAFLATPGEKTSKIEVYTFEGTFTGAVCRFKVHQKTSGSSMYIALAALGGSNIREGFIVFDDSGRRGAYTEVKDNKIGKREAIFRVN